jgi:hypothetical protein
VPSAFPPGTDPNVVACFQAADRDGSGMIDDKELQSALSGYNQSFSLRTVHLLMYLFTNTNVRKIGESIGRPASASPTVVVPLALSFLSLFFIPKPPSAPDVVLVRSAARRQGSIRGSALISLWVRAGALLVVLISGGQRSAVRVCVVHAPLLGTCNPPGLPNTLTKCLHLHEMF